MRAVAGAVPAFFERVPMDDAACVRARCGAHVQLPAFAAIRSDFAQPLSNDGPFAYA
jgi:hypothetical protein